MTSCNGICCMLGPVSRRCLDTVSVCAEVAQNFIVAFGGLPVGHWKNRDKPQHWL